MTQAWREDGVFLLASGLTFDALVAGIPFLILVLTVMGALLPLSPSGDHLDLHGLLAAWFPRSQPAEVDPLNRMERIVGGLFARRASLSLVGIPLLLLLATRLFSTVRIVLNRIFRIDEARPWLRRRLAEAFLVCVAGSFMFLNVAGTLSLGIVAATIGLPVTAGSIAAGVTFVTAGGLFFTVFRVAPSSGFGWRSALVAAVSCALFFEVAKWGFAAYLGFVMSLDVLTPDVHMAGLMLLLAWLYLTALAFLGAAEVAAEYRRRRGRGVTSTHRALHP